MSMQIRAQEFPDLGDEVMYPRLSAAKLEQLAKEGTRRSFAVGDVLYEQGERDAPFLVIDRAGATNRVAGAVGDGGLALRFAHHVLDA
jgi:hypothetical protein